MMNKSVDKEVFCLKLQIDKTKFRKMSSEDTNLLASLIQIGTEQELLRKLPKKDSTEVKNSREKANTKPKGIRAHSIKIYWHHQ